MDIGCNGLTMLERAIGYAPKAKVIILSGYRDFGYAQKALKLGAFDYLVKPTDIDILTACIQKVVEELDKTPPADDMLIDDIILDSLANHPQIIAINMIKTKLSDSMYQGEIDKTKQLYDEYLNMIDRKIEDENVKKVALYQLAKDMNNIRSNVRHISYTPLVGLKELIASADDKTTIRELIWDSIVKIVDDITESTDTGKSLKIQQMKQFIAKNYNKSINLKDIADHVYISTYYASKIFKKETGTNMIEYLNYYRVEKAKEFLVDLSYKVYEIADLVGILDSHYFSRIFKKNTGYTPMEYRDLHVNGEKRNG